MLGRLTVRRRRDVVVIMIMPALAVRARRRRVVRLGVGDVLVQRHACWAGRGCLLGTAERGASVAGLLRREN
jgi:hypothetical protein